MNLTNTFNVLSRHKFLLVVGLLIAVLAAFATAFRVENGIVNGALEPRAESHFRASTQLLVSDPTSVFSTKNAPQVVVGGQNPPAARDLSALTVVYAYIASGADVRAGVEAKIGALGANESITAAQRTTQPTSATNTGTYRLPILEIMGESTSATRAQEISKTAAEVFAAFAASQQDASGVTPDLRVQFATVRQLAAEPLDGTSPLLPVVAVGVGVLLAFLALIFAVDNARATRHTAPARAQAQSPRSAPSPSGQVPVAAGYGAPPSGSNLPEPARR
ncbi:MAG: hypothetical protein JWP19_2388 [Rhodoglobus sp.]|jgi:uncharacterized integral membrane protein|nr:hypothetical protein [Rhodoglobus sp.]